MPLTSSGNEVMANMKKQYGGKKGEAVFYASIKAGKPGSQKWHQASGKSRARAIMKGRKHA